jgi:hypothetical protein
VFVPWGQYDDTKIVNIGANRWAFKPEVGISKAIGPWTLEGTAGVTIYTDKQQFLRRQQRSQDPLIRSGTRDLRLSLGDVGVGGCDVLHRRPNHPQCA